MHTLKRRLIKAEDAIQGSSLSDYTCTILDGTTEASVRVQKEQAFVTLRGDPVPRGEEVARAIEELRLSSPVRSVVVFPKVLTQEEWTRRYAPTPAERVI